MSADEVSEVSEVSDADVEAAVSAEVGSTVGVEEEFHLIDPGTAELAPGAKSVLAHLDEPAEAQPELLRSAVETATPVCRSLAEVAAELGAARSRLAEACAQAGLWVAAAGTVPDGGVRALTVYPARRYARMAVEYQQLVEEQAVCACQVQVGVADRELAVAAAGRVRIWLPVLLALSASSPFYRDGDTGYASYRSLLWSRWPTSGPPEPFSSAAEYDSLVEALVGCGVIADTGMVYYDARPSARYATVEVRVADACPRVDDAVLLAGLARAMVITAVAEEMAGRPAPTARPELVRAATWRAARSGMSGDLIDLRVQRPVPAQVLLDSFLHHLDPALRATGDAPTVARLLESARSRDTSAARQRAAYARRGNLHDVVTDLVAETAIPPSTLD
jgi:glutamate---cysteine ligase / carboxylate-amine ligase